MRCGKVADEAVRFSALVFGATAARHVFRVAMKHEPRVARQSRDDQPTETR
jgi:hypothetical protein